MIYDVQYSINALDLNKMLHTPINLLIQKTDDLIFYKIFGRNI